MAVTQPAAAPAGAAPAAGPRRRNPLAPARTRAGDVLAGVLLALCLYAAFADGAVALVDEARLQAGIALAALGGAAVWLSGGGLQPRASRAGWLAVGLLAGFAAWSGLSLIWSVTPDLTWTETNRAVAYSLVLVLAFALGAHAERIATGLLVIAVVVALYALGGKVLPSLFDHAGVVARLREPLGYWNALALLCVLAIPIAARLRTRPALAALWLLLVVAGLTYSRGALLALAVALAVLVALEGTRPLVPVALAALAAAPGLAYAFTSDALTDNGVRVAERASAGRVLGLILLLSLAALIAAGRLARDWRPPGRALAIALGIAALAFVATGGLGRAVDSFTATREAPSVSDPGRLLSTNSGNRWVWWKEAAGAWSDRPLLGHGAGSFPVVHLQYRKDLLPVRQPHDVPLEFAAETGAVGALLGVGAIAALLVAAAAGARRQPALLAAGAAWAAHTLVDWDWDIPAVTMPALLALGVLAARPAAYPRARPRPAALALVAAATCLYLVSVALPAWSRDKSDDALAAARENASPAQLQQAAADAELAARLDPLSARPLFAAAAIAQRRERVLEQRRLLLRAVDREPSSVHAWIRLSEVAVRLGDREGAVRAARAAQRLDPGSANVDRAVQDAYVFEAPPTDSPTATGTPFG